MSVGFCTRRVGHPGFVEDVSASPSKTRMDRRGPASGDHEAHGSRTAFDRRDLPRSPKSLGMTTTMAKLGTQLSTIAHFKSFPVDRL